MLRKIIGGLADIIYPKRCLACKAPLAGAASGDHYVCSKCWGEIKKNVPPFCSRCGRHLKKNNLAKNVCSGCARSELHFDRAFSPTLYEGTIKKLLHEFKYKGKDYLGATLTKPMLEFITEYRLPMEYMDLVIPVPLHNSKLREREFNQAHILGSHIAREYKKEIRLDLLVRHRNTLTQTNLETGERLKNVKNCFSVTDGTAVTGKNILLVDDVLTTGATCSEAALALKNAGAGIVFALTLAN
ncbi:MAG: ComF family protein [Candidatus Omnitrophica bacterium]|nr:ComF family protein [Candidatus Omnitrophota bacterium]